jgi:signal transduction histidine kinase
MSDAAAAARRVLIVNPDAALGDMLRGLLGRDGGAVRLVRSLQDALAAAAELRPQLALIDARLATGLGARLVAALRGQMPMLACVVTAPEADAQVAIAALRDGACDYLVTGDADALAAELAACLARLDERALLRRDADYAELLEAKQAAEMASRSKSQFLATMSHELRTPLNAVIGFSELLMHEGLGPFTAAEVRSYAKDIHDSGAHLLQIINDILDLSKAEAGRLELREEVTEPQTLIEEAVRAMRPRAQSGGLTLTLRLSEGLPLLRADSRVVKQILLNLLSNAVKFTLAGGAVEISAECESSGDLAIAVRDTGIGMAPADIAKAFEPFRQIDNRLNRKYEGTGLGLPLVKAMMGAHAGRVDVESTLGAGTVVTVRFPAERVAPAAAPLSLARAL